LGKLFSEFHQANMTCIRALRTLKLSQSAYNGSFNITPQSDMQYTYTHVI